MEGLPVSGLKLPEVGDEIAGKYRIETVLGQGGMGTVFSAQNLLTGKRVAIKWLLPEHAEGPSRERLLREARIACSVEHPNIVDIYDVGEHQGGLFLVMEYLRGRPLSDVIAREGRLDPEQLIGLLIPAMRGVHAAHQAGVIHRDLKPENIILSEVDGQIVPKVVDFGVSKTMGASSVPHTSLTRTGALVGTPHYMALEQVDGSNLVDPRTDVYAFGVIMYRALTGHFPFDGSSLGEVILKIGTKDPLPLRAARPELPANLETAILRAMSRPRDLRYENLEEFARALEPFAPWVRFREQSELSGRIQLGGFDARGFTPQNLALSTPVLESSTPGRAQLPPGGMLGGVILQRPGGSATPQPIASAQGIGPRDTPAHYVERARRTRAFWLGAVLSALLLVAGFGWLLMRVTGESMARPSPAVPPPPRLAPAAAAPVTVDVPPQVEPPVQAEAPLAPVPGTEAPLAPVPEVVHGPEETIEPIVAPTSVDEARSPRKVRPRSSGRPAHPAQLIPGDRTKGLSSDDF